MKRSAIGIVTAALAGLGAVAVGLAFTAGAPAAAQACKAGVATIKGYPARVFCGPASAELDINGAAFVVAGGVCERYPGYFVVNIGTVVLGLGKGKPRLPYFGLLMGRSPAYSYDPTVAKDGTYRKGLITITTPKLEADLHNARDLKIALKNRRHAGTFSGTKPGSAIFNTPTLKVSGSFRC